jgi:hypothetical protein
MSKAKNQPVQEQLVLVERPSEVIKEGCRDGEAHRREQETLGQEGGLGQETFGLVPCGIEKNQWKKNKSLLIAKYHAALQDYRAAGIEDMASILESEINKLKIS